MWLHHGERMSLHAMHRRIVVGWWLGFAAVCATVSAFAVPVERRLLDVPIGGNTFCWARDNGCFYNYRSNGAQLVWLVSLNEGSRYQSLVSNHYGERWELDATAVEPKRHFRIEAKGAVVNPVRLTGEIQAISPAHVRITLCYERTLSAEKLRPRLLIYLAPWMKSEGAPFRVETPEGKVTTTLPSAVPLTVGMKPTASEAVGPYCTVGRFPAGSVTHIGLKGRAEQLCFTLDRPFTMSAFDFGCDLVGLWLDIENESETSFTLTMDHKHVSTRLGSGTDFESIVNDNTGMVRVISGGVPLLDCVELEEGTARQSASAGWKVATSKAGLVMEGKLVSLWRVNVTRRRESKSATLNMRWNRVGNTSPKTTMRIAFAHHLLGRTLVIIPGNHLPPAMAVKHIPRRIGANIILGSLPAGTEFWWHICGKEAACLRIEAACEAQLVREANRDATLHLVFPQKADAFSISLTRAQPPFPLYPRPQPIRWKDLAADKSVNVHQNPSSKDVSVWTPYWMVTHSQAHGGAIRALAFRYGTGNNLLLTPQRSSVVINGIEYSDINDTQPSINTEPATGTTLVKIIACGHLKAKNGEDSGIAYRHVFDYHAGYCKRTSVFDFGSKPISIARFCVARMDWASNLDEWVARSGDSTSAWAPTQWGKAVFPGPAVWEERTNWNYLALFDRGVEAVDLVPATATNQWKHTFSQADGRARYAICENAFGTASFVLEPHADPSHPIIVSGEKVFQFYFGLPRIPERLPRRFFQLTAFSHLCDEETIRQAAYAGVNLVLSPGELPGDYLRTKQREDNLRFIEWAHRFGMKCIPFLPFALLNENVEAYKQHAAEWQLLVPRGDRLVSPNEYSGYGQEMCAAAPGYREHVKQGETELLKKYAFDGIYHDFTHPMSCWNPKHHPAGEHTNMDGVVELLEWLRGQLRPGQIFEGHTGWVPTLMLQDLTDLNIIYEETSLDGVRTVVDMPGSGQFGNHVPSTLCCGWLSYNLTSPGEKPDTFSPPPKLRDVNAFLARCALIGLFPQVNTGQLGAQNPKEVLKTAEPFFNYFAAFRSVDLGNFCFLDFLGQTAVTSSNAFVRAATYWNAKQALIVVANSESDSSQHYVLSVDTRAFGWGGDRVAVVRLPQAENTAITTPAALRAGGITETLPGYGYHVWSLRTVARGKPAVVFVTRAWTEDVSSGRLVVTTDGPEGQPGRVVALVPREPSRITVDGKPVSGLRRDQATGITEFGFIYPGNKRVSLVVQ